MTFVISNDTNVPINVRISNAGITYFYVNKLEAGKVFTVKFHVAKPDGQLGAIWYDIDAMYSTPENQIDPKKENAIQGSMIGATALGLLAAVVGIGLMLLPGGQIVGAAATASAATGIVGTVATVGGLGVTIAHAVLHPAQLTEMYGPQHYNISVDGGMEIIMAPNDPTQFEVKDVRPIEMHWENTDRKTKGDVVGRIERPAGVHTRGEMVQVTLPQADPNS